MLSPNLWLFKKFNIQSCQVFSSLVYIHRKKGHKLRKNEEGEKGSRGKRLCFLYNSHSNLEKLFEKENDNYRLALSR